MTSTTLPPSHKVIRDACEEVGVKVVANNLRVSAALAYKWQEPHPTPANPDQSGALNPLDRVLSLCHVTQSNEPARWLCANLGGFYVPNPFVPQTRDEADLQLCRETRDLLCEFTELLKAVTDSGAEVDASEAACIRQRWEDLKLVGERFTVACERGHFG